MENLILKTFSVLALLVAFISCEDGNTVDPDLLEGYIVYLPPPDNCNDYVIVTGEGESFEMLKPNNLADSLQVDSLKILFSYTKTDGMHSCGFSGSIPVVQLSVVTVDNFSTCRSSIEVDGDAFRNEESENFFLNKARIIGDCLLLEVSASGCSGISWDWKLVDSGAILESYPVQRNIRLILDNPELCQAQFEKTIYFDLSPIQLPEYEIIKLNLDGFNNQLEYIYP